MHVNRNDGQQSDLSEHTHDGKQTHKRRKQSESLLAMMRREISFIMITA